MESEQISWRNCQISAELEAEGLRGVLESAFSVRFSEPIQTKTTFFDSFEWGIWFGEQLLFQAGGQLQLCGRDHDWIGNLQQSFPTSAKRVPHFAREFPRGPFRTELERLIGARSLQSVARLSMREQGVELFNQAKKTVFRFDLTDLFATENAPTPFYRLCHFQPLKGYEAEAAKAIKLLQTLGAREISEGPLALFLRESGSVPRRYTLRPTFDLTPELTIRETARRIIQKILAIARENERGICQDIDTEFLHDYRICMRKIRSILSLIPGIYPKEKMTELKAQFANYCEATNSLRDLDVYLLAREQYTEMLPGALRPPLEQVFHDFAKARRRALRRVTNHLGSPQYQTSIEAMERFFAALADLPETNVSKDPAGPLIAKSIYKRYRRIVKIERSLGADTPDAVLHEVRIHCKKLRYLIE
ncbi:MAG TPA: CHAD domain-containing protein, partial [Terrimicrobiaceae bacterium]